MRLLRAGLANIAEGLDVLEDWQGHGHAVRSKQYGFVWHAFAPDMTADQILQRERARLPRMAEILLDHIREGERIFVRHNLMEDEEPSGIAHALRAIGPDAVLLHVRPATPIHPHGTVLCLGDGLLTGFIEVFADGSNIPGTTRPELWLELCRNALHVRDHRLPWHGADKPLAHSGPGPGHNVVSHRGTEEGTTGPVGDALAAWGALAARLPGYPYPLLAPIQTLLAAGRYIEARVLLDAAQFRFPYYAPFAIEAGRAAQRQGAAQEAQSRWQALRERFPDAATGFIGAAASLRDAGRADEAEALLAEAIPYFPDDLTLAIDYAWIAHARRDWLGAVLRWQTVRKRAPEIVAAYTAGALALRELGRMEEAEALLNDAAERFHAAMLVVMEQAWLAQARRDWPEAARRWEAVRTRYPEQEHPYTAGARAMRELGRRDDAERLLREAIARFPHRKPPLTEHAWLAHILCDWPAAVERWAAVRARYPDDPDAYVQAAQALKQNGQHEEAERLLAEGAALLPKTD